MKHRIRLDICTLCNLNCPACSMRKYPNHANGNGYLTFENFKKFIDRDGDKIEYIEISNYGEPLLNPDFIKIVQYAYEHNIVIDCANGTNLNIRNDNILKALVDNQVYSITVSCDGVSQEAYSKYRVNGDINLVYENIKKINEYKLQKRSIYPLINWQYILRESSEDEAELAIKKAQELNVNNLFFKLTFEKDYVPKNEEWLKKVTGLKQVTRKKFNTENKTNYGQKCFQLWDEPAINWNGDLLGCCKNKQTFGVNVFEVGLEEAMNSVKYKQAMDWASGNISELPGDSPCVKCNVYKTANELHQSPIIDNMPLILNNAIQLRGEEKINSLPEITIFSLDLNDYFKKPIQQMCLESWYAWKANNPQIKEIKIFTVDSPEFNEFLTEYQQRKYDNTTYTAQVADAFRMYILSKYPNHLWLDGDVYINETGLKWTENFHFFNSWFLLYNGDNLDFYKNIFNLFLTEDLRHLKDEQICTKFKIPFHDFSDERHFKTFLHLCQIKLDVGNLIIWSSKTNAEYIDQVYKIFNYIMKVESKVVGTELEPYCHKITQLASDIESKYIPLTRDYIGGYGPYVSPILYEKLVGLKNKGLIPFNHSIAAQDSKEFKQLLEDIDKLKLLKELSQITSIDNIYKILGKYTDNITINNKASIDDVIYILNFPTLFIRQQTMQEFINIIIYNLSLIK